MTSEGTATLAQLKPPDLKLVEACKKGDLDLVKAALSEEADASVRFKQTLEETTPLIVASQRGHTEVVSVLIEAGAKLNEKMGFGNGTALLQAVSNEHLDCAELLLKHGANVNSADKLGRTALMDAAENGNLEMVRLLVSHKAEIATKDRSEMTALSYCLDFVSKDDGQYYALAKALIFDYNASPEFSGRTTTRTMLHCAAARGDLGLVQSLVEEKDCLVNVLDTMGYDPATYASKAGHAEIATYLANRAHSSCCIIM